MAKPRNKSIGIHPEAYEIIKEKAANEDKSIAVVISEAFSDEEILKRPIERIPTVWSRAFLALASSSWAPWYRELEILSTLDPGDHGLDQSYERAKRFRCLPRESFELMTQMFARVYGIRTYEGRYIVRNKPKIRWSKVHSIWITLRSEGFDEDYCLALIRRLICGS